MEGMGLSRSLMTLKHCTGMVDGKKRYLVRPKRYERKEPSRDSRKIYIYCEGNRREYDYFMFFRGLSSNWNSYRQCFANYHEQNKMPELFSTEVYKLGKVILPFVKDVLSGSGDRY